MHRILVIGAVQSTKYTLRQLIQHGFNVVGVLGHEPVNKELVSGWADLCSEAKENGIDYKGFKKINQLENIDWAKQKKPDIIFAVGFSQLMKEDWLNMPTLGCIGFHPTKLPKGRGRAPLAWLILEEKFGAANFFLMGEGADDGPIFSQEIFPIEAHDDASSIEEKIKLAIIKGLDNWLPELKKGIWNPVPQDHSQASWYGKRTPEDGHINWNNPAELIDRLIKASSKPHPGAYTYFKDQKLIIWKSEIENDLPIKGVVGKILQIDTDKGYLVQCGNGLIWIKDIESEVAQKLRIGNKLGYNIEDEIYSLKKLLKSKQNEK